MEELLVQGRLPVLRGLKDGGASIEIETTAGIGSGSVWPTFLTGRHPIEHGISNEWTWDEERMDVVRFSARIPKPFWKAASDVGVTVGAFDVPFAAPTGLDNGFEVCEWGPHDLLYGHTMCNPEAAARTVAGFPRHTFLEMPFPSPTHCTPNFLRELCARACDGAELRSDLVVKLAAQSEPDLIVTVFPEIHHLGHHLWHTLKETDDRASDLLGLIDAVDAAIGRLIETLSPRSTIVFSLHGMKYGHGIPTPLTEHLEGRGLSFPATWSSRSWSQRARSVLATMKARAPQRLRNVYGRRVPKIVQFNLARHTIFQHRDWSRTRAFELPTDQLGLIRLNVEGRERLGIVPPSHYEQECDKVEEAIRELRTRTGEAAVSDVVRPLRGIPVERHVSLPDIVVLWAEAAHEAGVALDDPARESTTTAPHRTGQHTPNTFCFVTGPLADVAEPAIHLKDLSGLMLKGVRSPGAREARGSSEQRSRRR